MEFMKIALPVFSVLVALGALAVSVLNRRRSTLKEKTDVTRALRERLARAEPRDGVIELPSMLFGTNNVTFLRKHEDVWSRLGPLLDVFEDLSLLWERGFVDRELARAYFAEPFERYRSQVFDRLKSYSNRDSLLLARIQRLGGWLTMDSSELESAQDSHDAYQATIRGRDAFDEGLREALKRVFPSAEAVDLRRVRAFCAEYDVRGSEGIVARLRLDPTDFQRNSIESSVSMVELLTALLQERGLEYWNEHPGAVGEVVQETRLMGNPLRAETVVDLVFSSSPGEGGDMNDGDRASVGDAGSSGG